MQLYYKWTSPWVFPWKFSEVFISHTLKNTSEQLLLSSIFCTVLVICNILFYLTPKSHKCDALRDFVPFVQFKKCEKHPWRSVTFNKVAGWLNVILFHGCFSRFLNCTNSTKLLKVSQILFAGWGSGFQFFWQLCIVSKNVFKVVSCEYSCRIKCKYFHG